MNEIERERERERLYILVEGDNPDFLSRTFRKRWSKWWSWIGIEIEAAVGDERGG